MRILEGITIEKLISFINDISENHWILVEWFPDPELNIIPSVSAVTKQHLEIFRNWIMENEDFMWTNEQNDPAYNCIVKNAHEILQECVFYYDDNMILLYQRLHELSQKFKFMHGNKYTFLKFVEDILESESIEKYQQKKNEGDSESDGESDSNSESESESDNDNDNDEQELDPQENGGLDEDETEIGHEFSSESEQQEPIPFELLQCITAFKISL